MDWAILWVLRQGSQRSGYSIGFTSACVSSRLSKCLPRSQMEAGVSDAELKQLLTEKVPRIRYQLWNGKRKAAWERIEAVYGATKRLEGSGSIDDAERVRRFRQHMIDLRDYLRL